MHHTDLPVARLPCTVSPLRELPLAEKNHFVYGDAPFPGQLFPSSHVGQVCLILRFPHLVG